MTSTPKWVKSGSPSGERRFKLYRRGRLSLTAVLPLFTHFGVEVIDEHPYQIDRSDGVVVYVYDFGLKGSGPEAWVGSRREGLRELFQNAFSAVWESRAESDGFNALVLGGELTWRQVVILRAVAKYLRQTCLLYTSPSPRDRQKSRMPSSA